MLNNTLGCVGVDSCNGNCEMSNVGGGAALAMKESAKATKPTVSAKRALLNSPDCFSRHIVFRLGCLNPHLSPMTETPVGLLLLDLHRRLQNHYSISTRANAPRSDAKNLSRRIYILSSLYYRR